jgi:hypothetical protein
LRNLKDYYKHRNIRTGKSEINNSSSFLILVNLKPFHLSLVLHSSCSMSHSEGQTYNILNNDVLNAEKLRFGPLQNKIRALNRMRAGKMEDHFHTAGDQSALKAEEKSLRKIASKGWGAARSRGYDVVSNCPFGPQGASPSLSVADPTRPFSTSQILRIRLESLPSYSEKRIIIQNNYLGAHVGTGMNIRRAHTSYPTSPIKQNTTDVDDEGEGIEDLEQSQRDCTTDIMDIKDSETKMEAGVASLHLICGRKSEPNWNDPRSALATLSNSTSRQFAGKSPHSIFVSGNPKSSLSDSGRSLYSLESRILSVRTGGLSRAM